MRRIYKTVKALGLLIRDPWKLNLILDQNATWERFVRKNYGQASLPVVPLNFFIRDAVWIEPFAFLDGGSMPTDIALLKQLASDIPGCRYFEIGTWRGESVSNVAAVSGVCYSLNLPDEEIHRSSGSEDYVKAHRFFSEELRNIIHLYGDSQSFNFKDLNQKFDLIYIDGDHHYESVVRDTQNILRYLRHEETIVVWHDSHILPKPSGMKQWPPFCMHVLHPCILFYTM
jgi:hypothetical protein